MTENEQYARAVADAIYPSDTSVPLDDEFVDDRGMIENLLLHPMSVARITSARGSVRANHFHRTDWHYAFVEKGRVLYFERAIGDRRVPDPKAYEEGEMFFTRPNVEHAMLFAEDSIIFTFAKNVRSHDSHEADLVRVDFVTPEIVDRYLP